MSFDQDAMTALEGHPWPGNVRELRNVVERAAALSDGPVITRMDLVFGREAGPSPLVAHDLAMAGAEAAKRAAAELSGTPLPPGSGPAIFDPELLKPGLGFKESKQKVVDAFETAYLGALRLHSRLEGAASFRGLARCLRRQRYRHREARHPHRRSPPPAET